MASIVSVSFLEITSFIKRVIPIPCSPDIHKTGAADVPFIKSCRVFLASILSTNRKFNKSQLFIIIVLSVR